MPTAPVVRQHEAVDTPPLGRRLCAVAIDLVLLLVATPFVVGALAFTATAAFDASIHDDCISPCDGSALAFASLALVVVLLVWTLYWPVLICWRRSTVGSRLVGLEFAGKGLRRRFVWRQKAEASSRRARP